MVPRLQGLSGMAAIDVNPAADALLSPLCALGAMGLSLMLELNDRRRESRFVGQWPAPLLLMGMYNKLVKTLGRR